MSHPRTNEEMKEDMATANDIVDIAGVWYFMGEKKKIKGLFKNKQQFQTDFDNSIRTEWLFRTYLPYSIESADRYALASDNEKEELITLLTKRKDAIFSSPRFKSTLIKNIRFQANGYQLEQLIEDIRHSTLSESMTVSDCADYKVINVLIDSMWYLLHPDKEKSKESQCAIQVIQKAIGVHDVTNLTDFFGLMEEHYGKIPLSSLMDSTPDAILAKANAEADAEANAE